MPPVTERIGEILDRIVGHETIPNIDKKISYVSEKLFPLAQSDIKIVAWELPPEFYNDEGVVKALEEAAERGVEIEILHGPKLDIPDELSRLQQEEKVMLLSCKEAGHVGFITVDRRHAIVEEADLSSYAVVRTNTIFLAKELEEEFAKLKLRAQTS